MPAAVSPPSSPDAAVQPRRCRRLWHRGNHPSLFYTLVVNPGVRERCASVANLHERERTAKQTAPGRRIAVAAGYRIREVELTRFG